MPPEGHEPCELLAWDSDFWGVRIARARADVLTPESVDQIDAWSRRASVRCLYLLARSDSAETQQLADDHRFRQADVRVTFRRSGPKADPSYSRIGAVIRNALPADLSELRNIARTSYHDTRFYYDPRFPKDRCDTFYETWITRSCEGYADGVLVAELDNKPVGYVTCHIDSLAGRGSIGLVGVGASVQGSGVGRKLVLSALKWFAERDLSEVSVVTQGRNIGAQRLYQRCGFLTHSVHLWYHKWYMDTEASD